MEENNWDLVIKPKKHLLDIDLKGVWQYRDLIVLFVRRDFVARYKQTLLGPLWFLIGPLLTTLVYTFVFNKIAKIPTEGAHPMLFYLSGIVGWQYFAACLNGTSGTFTANAGMFGKVYFPRLVTPISTVISNLIQFVIQFLLFYIVASVLWLKGDEVHLGVNLWLIPILLMLLALIALGVGILISSLTTKYRDLSQLMGFGVQLWMYATPVIYPRSMVPEQVAWAVNYNPVASLIEGFKYALAGIGEVDYRGLLYAAGFALVMLVIGVILFNRTEQTFMDTV